MTKEYMSSPAIVAALEALKAVIEKETGSTSTDLLVVAQPGGGLPMGSGFIGCPCPSCTLNIMITAARALRRAATEPQADTQGFPAAAAVAHPVH